MTKKEYEYQCLSRHPAFVRDLEDVRRRHPLAFGYFTATGFVAAPPTDTRPEAERAFQAKLTALRACFERHPSAAAKLWTQAGWLDQIAQTTDEQTGVPFSGTELEVLREFQRDLAARSAFTTKYPWVENFSAVSMVIQPFPLVFDPAWKVCLDHAVIDFMGMNDGREPVGLVTRAGIEPMWESEEMAQLYERARQAFAQQPGESRNLNRKSYAPAIFESARVFLPIGPETTLEQVSRAWPTVRQAQRAAYGPLYEPKKRAPRKNPYEERIRAYDLVARGGATVRSAAQLLKKPPRTVLRRFHEALRDIEGEAAAGTRWSPDEFFEHISSCPTCRKAEKSSDEYCKRAQRQLGRRSALVDRRQPFDEGLPLAAEGKQQPTKIEGRWVLRTPVDPEAHSG